MAASPRKRPSKRLRRGQSLVEFAVVALATYMLLAAILTFGFYFYAAQGAQAAVDLAARELSRTPLPAVSVTTKTVIYSDYTAGDLGLAPAEKDSIQQFRKQVYDPHYLVLRRDDVILPEGGLNMSFVGQLPTVNQQLIPLMVRDEIDEERYLRYPGAIVADDNTADDPAVPAPTGYLVMIPLVSERSALGAETIRWVPVLEPILMANSAVPSMPEDQFPITSSHRGIVALRINYPSQSAAMTSFRPAASSLQPNIGQPNVANDDLVTTDPDSEYAPEGDLVAPDEDNIHRTTYRGIYGLGRQQALGQQVRPFRRVISAQAIYRREIFQ
ncbi:hypothetical protein ETAA8_21230 [Anatilimnocola aggregata]|uniref:TadE-like domain-containing protein n=1 Tax=Anatilimnocola aggregata TaxID=2528021 RepID=A0A517Y9Y1_9BACT|nr:TadE family protein [Anatilimnocola aggregata]QDU27039.1 hypothetical protein ETAA8_21230 [Anatilimnocola aggregata]